MKEKLVENLQNILEKNYQIKKDQFVVVVYDLQCTLAKLLTEAYRTVVRDYSHQLINFDDISEDCFLNILEKLPSRSLVILVQSVSFRMTKHRLRADLFRQGHLVIEHARLGYNTEEQIDNYVDALAYNTPYYVKVSTVIERLLLENSSLRIESGDDAVLEVNSAFEQPIKNTGDFSDNPIIAAGFPIGEIFTEAKELDKINGSVVVFGFPTIEHKTYFCEPFLAYIENGCVVGHNGPLVFENILQLIRQEEVNGVVQIREIGFGLNRGIGFDKMLNEPTAFERFAGMHFSLGLKHAMYGKKLGRKVFQKYHIDIFCKVNRVFIGKTLIFESGEYLV